MAQQQDDNGTASRNTARRELRIIRTMQIGSGNHGMRFKALLLTSLTCSSLISAQATPVRSPWIVASAQPTTFFVPAYPTATPAAMTSAAPSRDPTSPPPSVPLPVPYPAMSAPVIISSAAPSRMPVATVSPVVLSTTPPSEIPISMTAAPTQIAPSTRFRYKAKGNVYIQLNYVGGNMTDDIVKQFEHQCSEFFNQALANISTPVLDIDSKLLSQELLPVVPGSGSNNTSARYLRTATTGTARWLQSDLPPLLTLVRCSGKTTSPATANNMNDILYSAVLNDTDKFIQLLQLTVGVANLYFQLVQTVIPFNADDPNVGRTPTPAPTPAPSVLVVTPTPPTSVPSPLSPPPTTETQTPTLISSTTTNSSSAPTTNSSSAPTTNSSSAPTTNSTSNSTGPAPSSSSSSSSNNGLGVGAVVAIVLAVCLWIVIVGIALWYTTSSPKDVGESADRVAPADRPTASISSTTAAESKKSPGGPSPAAKAAVQQHPASFSVGDNQSVGSSIITQEQPQRPVGLGSGSDHGSESVVSYAFSLGPGNFDSTVEDSSLPNGTIAGDDSTTGGQALYISRKVTAPAGRLGIVIDTTLEGPVVRKVPQESPLEGFLFPGDIIVAIDDVDTRAMPASALAALMVKTANQERILTVLSEDG